MTCDECELLLLEAERTAELEAHLQGCERCRAFASDARAVVALAALPPLSSGEHAQLSRLPLSALAGWRRSADRRHATRWAVGLLAAAAVAGLVVTSALGRKAAPDAALAPVAARDEAGLGLGLDDDWDIGEPSTFDEAGDDTELLEVSWTGDSPFTLNDEGEAP